MSKADQPLMVALVTLDVAYAQEASGACDPDAITGFEAVLQLPAHWLRGEAYLGIGRCHEKTGASRKAVAIYERALSDREIDEVTRQMISERLALFTAVPQGARIGTGHAYPTYQSIACSNMTSDKGYYVNFHAVADIPPPCILVLLR